jgi:hypothetical protein
LVNANVVVGFFNTFMGCIVHVNATCLTRRGVVVVGAFLEDNSNCGPFLANKIGGL